MAIEDAVILADHLARDVPVHEALASFYDSRIERVREVYDISMKICREETSPAPSVQRIYDLTEEGYRALATRFLDEPVTSRTNAMAGQ